MMGVAAGPVWMQNLCCASQPPQRPLVEPQLCTLPVKCFWELRGCMQPTLARSRARPETWKPIPLPRCLDKGYLHRSRGLQYARTRVTRPRKRPWRNMLLLAQQRLAKSGKVAWWRVCSVTSLCQMAGHPSRASWIQWLKLLGTWGRNGRPSFKKLLKEFLGAAHFFHVLRDIPCVFSFGPMCLQVSKLEPRTETRTEPVRITSGQCAIF